MSVGHTYMRGSRKFPPPTIPRIPHDFNHYLPPETIPQVAPSTAHKDPPTNDNLEMPSGAHESRTAEGTENHVVALPSTAAGSTQEDTENGSVGLSPLGTLLADGVPGCGAREGAQEGEGEDEEEEPDYWDELEDRELMQYQDMYGCDIDE